MGSIRLFFSRQYFNIIVFMLIFWEGSYILFSYYVDRHLKHIENQALCLRKKEELNQAIQQLHQFIRLTEARLINTKKHPEAISRVLSFKPDLFVGKFFPEIVSLCFSFLDNPRKIYSRYGTVARKQLGKSPPNKNNMTYIGESMFELNKVLFDYKNKPYGYLSVVFSIEHLIYDTFAKDEISFYPNQEKLITQAAFLLEVKDFSFILVIH